MQQDQQQKGREQAQRMNYVIELKQVEQTFVSSDGSPITALQAVDLGLRRHEFVSIIGPSGCGKSTILRLDVREIRGGCMP